MPDDQDLWLPATEPARSVLAAGETPMTAAVGAAMTRYLDAARAAVLAHDTTVTDTLVADADPAELPPNLDAWPPRVVWDAATDRFLAPVVAQTWRAGWTANLGAEQIDVVSDTGYLAAHLADTATRLTGATWPDELYNAVRAAVVESVVADDTPDQLRTRIAQLLHLDTWAPRVATIARTELHAAYSTGAYHAGLARSEQFGEELSRQWLATTDSRTRLAHLVADGMVAGPGESFDVGGEALAYPHDPRAGAGNSVNCRCVLLWLDAAEARAARAAYSEYLISLTDTEELAVTAAAGVMLEPSTATATTTAAVQEGDSGAGDGEETAPMPTCWSGPLMAMEYRTGDSGMIQRVIGIPDDGYRVTNHPWLCYQRESAQGHEGKITVGRPEVVWIADADVDGQMVPHLWGAGTFDPGDDDAMEVARKIGDGYAGTVSADLDDAQAELRWLDADGKQVDEPDDDEFWDWLEGKDIGKSPIEYYHSWRFAGATLAQDPAFHTGWVQITDTPPGELGGADAVWRLDTEALVASAAPPTVAAVTAATPGSAQWCELVAARSWETPDPRCFRNPNLTGITKVTVSDDGRWVFGHVADWDTVHAVFGCPPPRCPHGGSYPRFHRHPVVTTDGSVVLTGPLTADGHAGTDEGVTLAAAQMYYDNPLFVLADVVAGQDEFGIWVSGVPRPGVSAAGVLFLHRYSFSGDWRDNMMIAACACSTPAFHVAHDPAVVALVAAAGGSRPRLAPARIRLRRYPDGSLAALVACGVVGTGAKHRSTTRRPGAPDGWRLYRDFQAAATVDRRVAAAAARVRGN
jgi:hypothetical protein